MTEKTAKMRYQTRLIESARDAQSSHLDSLMELFEELEDVESPRKERLLVEGIMALEAERQGALYVGSVLNRSAQLSDDLPSRSSERLFVKWVA